MKKNIILITIIIVLSTVIGYLTYQILELQKDIEFQVSHNEYDDAMIERLNETLEEQIKDYDNLSIDSEKRIQSLEKKNNILTMELEEIATNTSISYYDNGVVKEVHHYGDNKLVSIETFMYDSTGLLEKTETVTPAGVRMERKSYYYNNNEITNIAIQKWSNYKNINTKNYTSGGVIKSEYNYYEENKAKEYIEYENGELYQRTTFNYAEDLSWSQGVIYDNKDNVIRSYKDFNNEQGIRTLRENYDQNGLLQSRVYYVYKGNDLYRPSHIDYYDSEGNITITQTYN
ncbi:hypothetical protein RJG79_00700 [Mycoplasmatota bacterium WC44]